MSIHSQSKLTPRDDARLRALNSVHSAANEFVPKLRKLLMGFRGSQVATVAGELSAKFREAYRTLPIPKAVQVVAVVSRHSVRFTLTMCAEVKGAAYVEYASVTYFAGLDNGKDLSHDFDSGAIKYPTYDKEDCEKKLEAVRELQKRASAIKEKLPSFLR